MDFQWIILFLVPLSPPLPEAPSIGTCESLDWGGDVLPYHSGHNFPHDQFEILLSQPCSELITKQPPAFQHQKLLAIFSFPILYSQVNPINQTYHFWQLRW